MRQTAHCVLAGISVVLLLNTSQAYSQSSQTVMATRSSRLPVIVFIHGRGQAGMTRSSLERDWYDAFEDGMEKVGARGAIAANDRLLVRYEQHFESDYEPSSACKDAEPVGTLALAAKGDSMATIPYRWSRAEYWNTPEFPILSISSYYDYPQVASLLDWPQQSSDALRARGFFATERGDSVLLVARGDSATESTNDRLRQGIAIISEASGDRGALRSEAELAFDAADVFRRLRDFAARVLSPQELVRLFAEDTRSYLVGGNRTCDTDAILKRTLDSLETLDRPVVPVAHSMGALVSLRVLQSSTSKVRLVTIGAQVGWEKIPPLLFGAMVKPPFTVPAGVDSWDNV